MNMLSAIMVSLLLTWLSPLSLSAADLPTETVATVAHTWLGLIDKGEYDRSWQTASTFFQSAVSETAWSNALTAARAPLGQLTNRNLQTNQLAASLPGAPDGEYRILTFSTAFSRKQSATETLTLMREADGQWRAAGYFVK